MAVSITIEAEEKNWKTGFMYTAPWPIVGCQFDIGWERALYGAHGHLFKDASIKQVPYPMDGQVSAGSPPWIDETGKYYDITVFELPQPIQENTDKLYGFRLLWDYFLHYSMLAARDAGVQSIGVDTMSRARDTAADAYLESLQDKRAVEIIEAQRRQAQGQNVQVPQQRERLQQQEYRTPNELTRSIYVSCQGMRKNFIALHHLTDEYMERPGGDGVVRRERTGRRVLQGMSGTHKLPDLAMHFEKKEVPRLTEPSVRDMVIEAKFLVCGYNLSLEGQSIHNPTWDSVMKRVMQSIPGGRLELPLTGREEE